jgi:Uma2 family endonuclease
MTAVAPKPEITMGQAVRRLGGVSRERVRLVPYPATADDVAAIHAREGRLFELVDGILVEKVMGYRESALAMYLGHLLIAFVEPRRLGVVAGEQGMMRLASGLVRIPDLSFVFWDQLPGRQLPETPVPRLYPALAVEVLSEGNTTAEMDLKLEQFFASGTRLMWLVDARTRTVDVFTTPDRGTASRLTAADTLTGDPVLPGFALPLGLLFTRLDPQSPADLEPA